ncbi:hypothetical protein [Cupriavidus sp. USMAA2-4]|uniref:GspE/PulE/PilB domain-containing protein n=1 Tax=Cupriavidus sp. USMAA2-4 TaxID=876364 RepID=UPI000A049B1C|nr:hypothetical protein [Cupriavidus sp. USMAA2-4]
MNRSLPAEGNQASAIDAARAAARVSGRPISSELEVIANLTPYEALERVAAAFDMPVLTSLDLEQYSPAFDRLPLVRAMQRCVLLVRDGSGALLGAIRDPLDLDLQTWLEAQADRPVCLHLALQADIESYLARQEDSVRAVDELASTTKQGPRSTRTAEVLSYAAVNDTSSPIVRVVSSTLYDALRAGASDVHLESTPTGLEGLTK